MFGDRYGGKCKTVHVCERGQFMLFSFFYCRPIAKLILSEILNNAARKNTSREQREIVHLWATAIDLHGDLYKIIKSIFELNEAKKTVMWFRAQPARYGCIA